MTDLVPFQGGPLTGISLPMADPRSTSSVLIEHADEGPASVIPEGVAASYRYNRRRRAYVFGGYTKIILKVKIP